MLLPVIGLVLSYFASSEALQFPLIRPNASPLNSKFDTLVAETLAHWHTPGVSVAVVDGDQTFSKGYGIATFPNEKVTPSTLFHTASTTKSFTAAVVSLLVDDSANTSNPLTWQTPLTSHIREDFVLQDEWTTSHVTLEDALSHRTGMPRHDESMDESNTTIRDVVRKLRHLQATAEPRAKWQYCNMMYIVITHFIETYTGISLGSLLRARVWEPLAMNSTFFSLSDAEAATYTSKVSLARGYSWLNRTQEYRSVAYVDSATISGAGATISNVLDYAKWLRCMMAGAAPLSTAAHETLHFPRITLPTLLDPSHLRHAGFRGEDGYALGWFISNYRGEVMVWHNGCLKGFATMMAYLPRKQWGFTIMANSGHGGVPATQILSYNLLDDVLGIPKSERLSWSDVIEHDFEQAAEPLKDPLNHLYPESPVGDKAIPLTLPLSDYSGVYTHPAYLLITLVTKLEIGSDLPNEGLVPKQILHIDWYRLFGLVSIDFTHVSGEYFVIYVRHGGEPRRLGNYDTMFDSVAKAEFRLGHDGKVKELGLQLEEEMGDEKIWFTKVE